MPVGPMLAPPGRGWTDRLTAPVWRRSVAFGLAGLLLLSAYGLLVPTTVRCGLPGSVGCPGGVFGPAVQPAGAGVQWFDVVMYDWGFWIVDSTTGVNESAAWNVFEGWTVHVNATSQAPTLSIGGTAYHGLGLEISATGQQLLSLAAPVGRWVSASFVAPNAEYHHQHLWCTIECGPGHGAQQAWVLNVVPPSVLPLPHESANVTSGRAPLSVSFAANATLGAPPYNYTWNFGDGSPAAYGATAGHTYTFGGVYYAGLTVTDSKGFQGTGSLTVTVLSGAPLTAQLTASPTSGFAPALGALSVVTHGGTPPYRFSWDFGDGSTAVANNSTRHAFWSAGLYAVLVTVTDASGARASDIATVSLAPPTGSLSASINASAKSGSAPLVVALRGVGTGGTGALTFLWDLGDGSVATGANVSHTYNASGSYVVRLFAVDAQGRVGAATQPLSVSGAVVGGGGNNTNDTGGIDLLPAATAAVNSSAVTMTAFLALSPSGGPAPLTVTAATSVLGGTGVNESVSVSFGDGTSATGQVVSHTYATEGSYRVTATAVDSAGNRAQVSAPLLVGGPVVRVVENTSVGDAPFSILAAASVTGGSGVYGNLSWSWGDGNRSTGQVARHTYAPSVHGNVTLRASVSDSLGLSGNGSAHAQVFSPPSATLAATIPGGASLPVSVGLVLTVHGGSGGYSSQPLWTFGDATSGRAPPSTSHPYGRFGDYLVTVSTNDSYGRMANASVWVNLSLNLSLPKGSAPSWQLSGVPDPYRASLALLGMVGATGLLFLYRKRRRGPRRPSPPAPRAPGGPT